MADVLLAGDTAAVSTSVLAIDLNPISWLGDAASAAVAGVWKAAMIADVGSIDDRGFNQFTFEGTKAGAAAAGLPEPAVVIPRDESEYGQLVDALIADGNNIIVTTGFNLATTSTVAAKANPCS